MSHVIHMIVVCSRQIAEEVMRSGEGGDDQSTGFEGMEALAQAIELGKGPYFFSPSLFCEQVYFDICSVGSSSDFPQGHCISN